MLETIKTIAYALLIAVGVRTVALEPFNIPSGSMIPTLLIGDYLFVSKYSYGYSKHSIPFSPPLFAGRVFDSLPKRGDVAVFKLPRDGRTDYIKRIVGLPGDRIQMIGGILHINGDPVRRQRVEDYTDRAGVCPVRLMQYVESLPGGVQHRILECSDGEYLDNTREIRVPPAHLFAMGDNRDDSADSRDMGGVGFVPVENLVGRAEFLFFSTNGSARIWEIWKWPTAIRYDRLFQAVR
jgi:signal peptidase I